MLSRGGTRKELLDGYLRPNRDFFRAYLAFQTQGELDWDGFMDRFHGLWHGSTEEASPVQLTQAAQHLLGLVEERQVETLTQRGYRRAVGLLKPTAEIDLYVCVGLGLSNAFMVMIEDEPAVGVALEAYGRRFGTVFVGFEDLLHVIPHELSHAVRARETDSPLGRFFRSEAPTNAMEHVSLHEMVVEEGLACWTGAAAAPELPLEQILFYSPEDFRWCQENVDLLWEEFQTHKDLPLGNEGFTRWFGIGPDNSDLPPRAGYYLGYRIVEHYFLESPETDIAEAARQPAEAFLPQSEAGDSNPLARPRG